MLLNFGETGIQYTQNRMTTRIVLRVIVHENDIRKIRLHEKPHTVDSLVKQLEEELRLQYKFSLQYEDPDFNNDLVNLNDIADLPEKPTLKIISLAQPPTPSAADPKNHSVSSPDGSSLAHQSPCSHERSSDIQGLIRKSVQIKVGPPACYCLKTERINIDEKGKIRKWTIGKKDTSKKRKIILAVGETGTGKTSLINTMVNYVLGVRWEDKVWFEISDEKNIKIQTESQTSEITVYEIFPEQGPLSLSIIDTPGYGDTRGIEKDQEVAENLLTLFRSDSGIHEIDAVCLVVKASQNRLTVGQRYIFDSVLSLFGKDIAKNIVFMITHSCGTSVENVLSAIDTAKIPCARNEKNQPVHFLFNNCQTNSHGEQNMEALQFAAKQSILGMTSFFTFLEQIGRKNLEMTSGVLREQKQLKAAVNNLEERIRSIELKQNELTEQKKAVNENKEKFDKGEDFTVEFNEVYTEKVSYSKSATVCDKCKENCHKDGCWWVSNLYWCSVMSRGNCTVCSGRCSYTEHTKGPKIYETKTRKVQKTNEDLKRKYEVELGKKMDLAEVLQEELAKAKREKIRLINEAYQCIMELSNKALNPDAASILKEVEFLIPKLEETGNSDKAQKLKSLMEKAKEKGVIVSFLKAFLPSKQTSGAKK